MSDVHGIRLRGPRAVPVMVASLLIVVAACNGSGPEQFGTTIGPIGQTTVEQANTTVVPTAEAPTTTIAPDAAPPELHGTWRGEIEGQTPPFDRSTLSLTGTNYATAWGPDSHGGDISVTGDIIRFRNPLHCEGEGVYRWVVEGDTLTFTELEHDTCPRRVLLYGVTYTR